MQVKLKRPPKRPNLPMGTVQHLRVPNQPKQGLKIAVIPDTQVMPGVDMEHLGHAGQYIAEKRPDVIVCLGDFGDFPSLSRFERNTLHFEGRRYKADLGAFHEGMQRLLDPIDMVPDYNPVKVFTLGNHEDHIPRFVDENPILEGSMSLDDLCLEEYGWKVYPFLQPVGINGVAFCHYFPSGIMGRPVTSAPAIIRKLHMSAVAGHQQGRDVFYGRRADGAHMTSIITGSFYQHEYKYLSPFTNAHWRGMFFMHEVQDGMFDEMWLSINYLKRRYA